MLNLCNPRQFCSCPFIYLCTSRRTEKQCIRNNSTAKQPCNRSVYRDFPILDKNGKYKGMISRRNFLGAQGKMLILVDHNEKTQAVDGVENNNSTAKQPCNRSVYDHSSLFIHLIYNSCCTSKRLISKKYRPMIHIQLPAW